MNGWGSWAGPDVKEKKKKKEKKKQKKKEIFIFSQKSQTKAAEKYTIDTIPYPFTSVEQYER